MSSGQARPARIACVVVNFGASDLLAENLAPLERDAETQIVVVDNFSSDLERVRLTALARDRGWTLIASDGNPGFGDGANAGVAAALDNGAQVVCLLNPDACMSLADLRTMARLADEDRRAIVAPRIVTDDGRDWFTGARVDLAKGRTAKAVLDADGSTEHAWLTGACMVFHADAWRLTGGFDADYFLYWEDIDLSWRHVAAGGRLRYHPDVTVRHSVSGTQRTSGQRGRSWLYYYYNCRNRLLFASKHLDRSTKLRWVLTSLPYAREVLLRGGRRQLLRPWRPVTAVLRGTCTGLTRLAREL